MKFKFVPQHDQMDCGPAALSMISQYYGKNYTLQFLRDKSYITREGVSIAGISHAAKDIGLDPFIIQLTPELLAADKDFPCILHWNQNHFVVLYEIKKSLISNNLKFKIADPGHGKITLDEVTFRKHWISADNCGIAMFLKPTKDFYKKSEPVQEIFHFKYLYNHLKSFKWQIFQLALALLATSIITLIFPFLTQSIIDKGIGSKSLNIVSILLLAQVFLFIGSTIIDVVRNWIALYLGTRINIHIISDFLRKILKLPISFFDSKMRSDFNQRIQDQVRIENFLTSQSLLTLFSLINFLVFFFVLSYYDVKIVITYSLLSILAVGWSIIFLNRRKILDYYRFQRRSENQDSIYEFINGIQEIKLHNLENYKRDKWEKIQVKLFGINIRILKTDQLQIVGFDFINQFKNIIVTYIAAREVILGHISLGAMLSISYIIGQMNSPINQLITFFRSFQEAKLSLERLNDVQRQEEEEKADQIVLLDDQHLADQDIYLKNLSFQYGSPTSTFVLKNLNSQIHFGKTTAIVGSSGSGKTTLMKLLLKFYATPDGKICIGNHDLEDISPVSWRSKCGVVMQDGYIFADTIERNIVSGDEIINNYKLAEAIRISNMSDFIKELPLGLKTKIGASGSGISGGQKQRILIARAVYKNPSYLFFDEATSALDAENEKIVHDNLHAFLIGKTAVIIAHRLSTVKNADQIIVMKNGLIVETGNHQKLVNNKAEYYNLIKNQLELGN
ncbi:peptidase domain-containing ABC transporter [Pedobacter psychrotolerans]|uniref:peptidase domain-containing ABC transporter n=1 Tax=Pedobacter psychrotolerans TaxID=1843235 RepID=UPI003F9A5E80|nr:peptidase domain-containing ABC transporter [Atribacterota bacterium]